MTSCGATISLLLGAVPPRRAHVGDAGLDIALQEDLRLRPGETAYVPAGVKLDIPHGYAAHVMTRSGTFNHDVVVVPTIVDSNYKDEISTIVTNFNVFPVHLHRGDYLAQIVLTPCYEFDNECDVTALPTERDGGKFGSSDASAANIDELMYRASHLREMLASMDRDAAMVDKAIAAATRSRHA